MLGRPPRGPALCATAPRRGQGRGVLRARPAGTSLGGHGRRKRRDAPYEIGEVAAGSRSKCIQEQEFVVGGFTGAGGTRSRPRRPAPRRPRATTGRSAYAGQGRHRLHRREAARTSAAARRARADARRRSQERPPGARGRPLGEAACWSPRSSSREWTNDGRLRHPSFKGLREDKAGDARSSYASEPAGPRARNRRPGSAAAARCEGARSRERPGGDAEGDAADAVAVAEVRITPSRSRRVSGRRRHQGSAVARYYAAVADRILPHLRATARRRCCAARRAGRASASTRSTRRLGAVALRRVRIREKTKVGRVPRRRGRRAGLVALIQMGVLEIHTWNALCRAASSARPGGLRPRSRPDVPGPAVVTACSPGSGATLEASGAPELQ